MQSKICLIGFMGCGKSTLGKLLSSALDKSYVDLDEYIETKSNSTISDIFSTYGEEYFRQLEKQALKYVLNDNKEVIATGGGIISLEENISLLKQCNTFYLKYNFDTLYNRISGDSSRPLVTSYMELEQRFKDRANSYERSCNHIIECENKTINDILIEVMNYID